MTTLADGLWPCPVDDENAPDAPQVESPGPRVRTLKPRGFGADADKFFGTPSMGLGATEQYRKLAATLHHAQLDRTVKVVMIASALPGEGKTLTSTNLALTLSQSYRRRTLIIDADLRRPSVHHVFGLPHLPGLTEGLAAEDEQMPALAQLAPELWLLPGGSPNQDPMSGLTSNRMRRLITDAARQYDWVIIDTPPVGLMPDGNLLAAMVDAVVLVVAAGHTPCRLVQGAVETLGRERIIGVVLNRAAQNTVMSESGYYYGYGYGADRR
jgi:capsular exopolysaccharide synthesis family protein